MDWRWSVECHHGCFSATMRARKGPKGPGGPRRCMRGHGRSTYPPLRLHLCLGFCLIAASAGVAGSGGDVKWRVAAPMEVAALEADVMVAVVAEAEVVGDDVLPLSSTNLIFLQRIKIGKGDGNNSSDGGAQNFMDVPLGALALRSVNASVAETVLPCGWLRAPGDFLLRLQLPLQAQAPSTSTSTSISNLPTTPDTPTSSASKFEDATSVLNVAEAQLRVRWPTVVVRAWPDHLETFPDVPVAASVRFPTVRCQAAALPSPGPGSGPGPELWLELRFCGAARTGCFDDEPPSQVLYAEQLNAFPGATETRLACQLFGQAGAYSVAVRQGPPAATAATAATAVTAVTAATPNATPSATSSATPSPPLAHPPDRAAFIKVTWSDKFVFNVHARSVFPCDASGVRVLFQYPECAAAGTWWKGRGRAGGGGGGGVGGGDRVRLFARLRANVASMAPPSTLRYVAEQRVARGGHSLLFPCDLFSEHFVEYCFVYVSQALTGAVSDLRMDCLPTFPVAEGDAGSWGAWGPWSQCSSSCGGGVRSRFRACDSPPPRFGAPFCVGAALQTQTCGRGSGAWDCPLEAPPPLMAERADLAAAVGPGCRCGCTVVLGAHAAPRLLAASSRACPGRSFWLLQAEHGSGVRLWVRRVRVPCAGQWLRVRDGGALSSRLVAERAGTDPAPFAAPAPPPPPPAPLRSSGRELLLDFGAAPLASDADAATDPALADACGAEFIAHAVQIPLRDEAAATSVDEGPLVNIAPGRKGAAVAGPVAVAAVAALLLAAAAALAVQYAFRYRKYHRAASAAEEDTEAETPGATPAPSRASSAATLLSEVISLRRLGRRRGGGAGGGGGGGGGHSRLIEVQCAEERLPLRGAEVEAEVEADELLGEAGGEGGKTQPSLRSLSEETLVANASSFTCGSSHEGSSPVATPQRTASTVTSAEVTVEVAAEVTMTPTPYPLVRGSSAVTNGSHLLAPCTPKARKEQRNRRRLLAGSDLSLSAELALDLEMEMDYYDYNVRNAGAAPGSLLGMDPAFLLWIPPFAPGRWERRSERLLRGQGGDHPADLLAGDESAQRFQQLTEIVCPALLGGDAPPRCHGDGDDDDDGGDADADGDGDGDAARGRKEKREELSRRSQSSIKPKAAKDPDGDGVAQAEDKLKPTEKETQVEKSPSDKTPSDFCDFLDAEDDIKYADDEEDDCNNIIISESVISKTRKSLH